MAAVASPALRLRPRTAAASPPGCRVSSSAYSSYPKFARSFPVERVNVGRMQHLDALKGRVLRRYGNHDGTFHIKRITSFAATDKQEPIASPSTDVLLVEETESSTGDSTASGSFSYFTKRGIGKPGFISFQGGSYHMKSVESVPHPGKEASRLVWFVGPTILVAFLVLPSLYLRKLLSAVFEDSLLTVTTMVLSLIIPLLTMGMVWPWTGPAASATLAPYLVGLVVQFAFEQYARHRKSPSWPVIPIIFKVYRLHQLNRAAQLVTALTFSVRGTEATNQTLAIMNSLGALLTVLQILGVICTTTGEGCEGMTTRSTMTIAQGRADAGERKRSVKISERKRAMTSRGCEGVIAGLTTTLAQGGADDE
ncbi:hypothetical protein GUJ93_ZPchr0001g32247 [Zizania palustris]|uniref:Uncharacterized protein n=1 Tax=Zizania palustris TaxID=103762 RepID=A0A8J5SDR8_ZIZPA|nr:hypothetical protein GUJ93_ZPchr0001g32247 [Zizania palustris]